VPAIIHNVRLFQVSLLAAVAVGARVGGLVLQKLDEAIEDHRQYGTKDRAHPVYPVGAVKGSQDNVWTEGARWVQRSAGVGHA
jgi:hypothetical protein